MSQICQSPHGERSRFYIVSTTRADDGHAKPVQIPLQECHLPFGRLINACQTWVRYYGRHRIKPHASPLVQRPVNSFEF